MPPAASYLHATFPQVRARSLIRLVFAGLVLAATVPARAWDETKVDLRLSLSTDVFRAPGTMVVAARYGGGWGVTLGTWVRNVKVTPAPDVLAGAGYVWTRAKWRVGAGVAWINEENDLNGTRWNFNASVAYRWADRIFLEYQHYSHGAILGIKSDAPNGGWNLLGVGVAF